MGTQTNLVHQGTFDVVELRRYVLRPGRRDDLIELFEREFIESQEACGMVPLGHYRDLNDPDSFVWFRGFPRFEDRRRALEAFYIQSEAWLQHRDDANATMIDSDNVLLLKNARLHSGFDVSALTRPSALQSSRGAESFVAASIFMLEQRADEAFIRGFERETLPELREIVARVAYLVTEERSNDFPRLPVREGEWSFVVVGACPTLPVLEQWTRIFQSERCKTLRLQPAERSLFR